jgi:hypothetical protein
MSFLSCMNQLFHSYDYHQNKISIEEFKKHNTHENAWISYEEKIFSIQKDDKYLLQIFQDYYGKDVSTYIKTLTHSTQLDILQKLHNRCIGLIDKK